MRKHHVGIKTIVKKIRVRRGFITRSEEVKVTRMYLHINILYYNNVYLLFDGDTQ